MYILRFLVFLVCFMISTQLINGHGYTTYPLARQVRCNQGGGFNYPEDGSGISDPACRAAFQYVKARGNSAVYQFIQINEYSINIPAYADGYSALTAAVPTSLCSAGAVTAANDKSGMSLNANWQVTQIPTTKDATTQDVAFKYCATAPHNPSYWEFYVSKPGFNPATTPLTWANLELFQTKGDVATTPISDPNCSAQAAYQFTLSLPVRFANSILLTRWQRIDSVGETFIDCSDFINVAAGATTVSATTTSSSTTAASTTAASTTSPSTTAASTTTASTTTAASTTAASTTAASTTAAPTTTAASTTSSPTNDVDNSDGSNSAMRTTVFNMSLVLFALTVLVALS